MAHPYNGSFDDDLAALADLLAKADDPPLEYDAIAYHSSIDGGLAASVPGAVNQMAVGMLGSPSPPSSPHAPSKFDHAQPVVVKNDPTEVPMDEDPHPAPDYSAEEEDDASEATAADEEHVDGNAAGGGSGRCKQQERLNDVAEGWRAVACLCHKDDYELCINTNAKNRATKLYAYLSDPDNKKPPKGYKGELVDRVLIVDGNLFAIVWFIPGNPKFIVSTFDVMYGAQRSGAARTVRWKHPRHVISRQVEVEEGDVSPLVVAQVWKDMLSTVNGVEGIVLVAEAANKWLYENIVQNAGCFFYGPSTMKYQAVLTVEGTEYVKLE